MVELWVEDEDVALQWFDAPLKVVYILVSNSLGNQQGSPLRNEAHGGSAPLSVLLGDNETKAQKPDSRGPVGLGQHLGSRVCGMPLGLAVPLLDWLHKVPRLADQRTIRPRQTPSAWN